MSSHLFRQFAQITALGTTAVLLSHSQTLNDRERVGKAIFFDQTLSVGRNQSCAACHAPEVGWTGPNPFINSSGSVYEGSVAGRFGNRKPPSSAYATQSPVLSYKNGTWSGGNFWDGRATGQKLGIPAADQAQGPFLNPAEQALPAPACVVYRVCTGSYGASFTSVAGIQACAVQWPANIETACGVAGGIIDISPAARAQVNATYDKIGRLIAEYEASSEVNAFTSKFDLWREGRVQLTKEEQRGFGVFQGKGKCATCHISSGQRPLFTDFTYDNLGLPANPANPVYKHEPAFVDYGLGGYLKAAGYPEAVYMPELGKMKVPTLRNVDRRPAPAVVKAFGHNGAFKTLEDIVHFYNTRDVAMWPPSEYPGNVNRKELGNLGLTAREEADVIAFLKTLTDGYKP